MGRQSRPNRTAEEFGKSRRPITSEPWLANTKVERMAWLTRESQRNRSRRASARQAASQRTGIPEDLLPLWLGGAPRITDSAALPAIHPVDGTSELAQSLTAHSVDDWDLIKSLDALERHIATHGVPWQPGYTGSA